jgi:hypothetical protein
VEDSPSTNQPLESGQASMTTELTLQTDAQFDPLIATHPNSIRRSTREKHPSFKLRSAFSARIWTLFEPASYWEVAKHPYSRQ